ncbi:hypothetical protein NP233_g8883 [Leucocoprinus birnbaumii]|uniref:Protein kinase domain-containing protein n=1 Tax=Leucocoprinus birnbaumii TaxID=56174 RepID=A0AAD5VLG9_9AGAR|nr:hypothetical protein NP233_g8883 [Leucocoprinus birnbaumii]
MMYRLLRPPRALSYSRLFRRRFASLSMAEPDPKLDWPEKEKVFQQELRAIDLKDLVIAMGGHDKPPEENLFAAFDEGFGFDTSAAVNRSVKEYQYVRKLGWATSSTVWLVLDKSKTPRKFFAMKLLTSQASVQVAMDRCIKFDVYRKIGAANADSPGAKHCLHLLRSFTLFNPHGVHSCFVTDALSSSPSCSWIIFIANVAIFTLVGRTPRRNPAHANVFCQDVKSDNILTVIPDPVHSRIEKYVLENQPSVYGPPLKLESQEEPLFFSSSEPLPYFDLGGTLEDISVRLVDYGQAMPVDSPIRPPLCQPGILRAPEVTLKYPWTSAIDIWTVGCLLFELLTEQHLFHQGYKGETEYSHKLHLQHIEEYLGPFPPELLKNCEDRDKYFDDKGGSKYSAMLLSIDPFIFKACCSTPIREYEPAPIEDILRALEVMDEDEVPKTATFLRKCLALDPKLRPSAQDLLKDDWFR